MKASYGTCEQCGIPLRKVKCPKDRWWYVMWYQLIVERQDPFHTLMAIFWYKNIEALEKRVIACTNKKCDSRFKQCP